MLDLNQGRSSGGAGDRHKQRRLAMRLIHTKQLLLAAAVLASGFFVSSELVKK
jgi:hypothetical protein